MWGRRGLTAPTVLMEENMTHDDITALSRALRIAMAAVTIFILILVAAIA